MINLSNKSKTELYEKFLRNEVNWIEFYGRSRSLTDPLIIKNFCDPESVFYEQRMPANALKGINGMMKSICFYSIQSFRNNCQMITDFDQYKRLIVYDYWDLFCYDLPKGNKYTLVQAMAVLDKITDRKMKSTLLFPFVTSN